MHPPKGAVMLLSHLESIFRSLNEASVRYLVVGGVAVAAHGHPRYTADLDLVIALEAENAERAVRVLMGHGYRPLAPVAPLDFAKAEARRRWVEEKGMMVFQMRSEEMQETCVDLFIEEPFDFAAEYGAAPRLELVAGQRVPVVTYETLIEMKRRAGRGRDLDDIKSLEQGREGLGDAITG